MRISGTSSIKALKLHNKAVEYALKKMIRFLGPEISEHIQITHKIYPKDKPLKESEMGTLDSTIKISQKGMLKLTQEKWDRILEFIPRMEKRFKVQQWEDRLEKVKRSRKPQNALNGINNIGPRVNYANDGTPRIPGFSEEPDNETIVAFRNKQCPHFLTSKTHSEVGLAIQTVFHAPIIAGKTKCYEVKPSHLKHIT